MVRCLRKISGIQPQAVRLMLLAKILSFLLPDLTPPWAPVPTLRKILVVFSAPFRTANRYRPRFLLVTLQPVSSNPTVWRSIHSLRVYIPRVGSWSTRSSLLIGFVRLIIKLNRATRAVL